MIHLESFSDALTCRYDVPNALSRKTKAVSADIVKRSRFMKFRPSPPLKLLVDWFGRSRPTEFVGLSSTRSSAFSDRSKTMVCAAPFSELSSRLRLLPAYKRRSLLTLLIYSTAPIPADTLPAPTCMETLCPACTPPRITALSPRHSRAPSPV